MHHKEIYAAPAVGQGSRAAVGFLLALGALAAGCATPRTAPPSAVAPPAGASPAPSVRTASYELHAPSDAIAQTVRVELDRGAATFGRYFGAAPPPIGVVVFKSVDEMRAFDWTPIQSRTSGVLPWLVQFEGNPTVSASTVEGERALSHEACHMFLIGQTSRTLGRAVVSPPGSPLSYGDPALPDWFDEGVATLCEPESLHQSRVAQLRAAGDSTIPFPELFRMEHPAWRQLQAMLDAQRAATGDTAGRTGPGVTTLRVRRGALVGVRSGTFYSQTNSVLEFLAEREGPRFVGRLGEGLARGQTVEQVLAAHARTLPRDVAGLEREWKAWRAAR